LLLLLRHLCKKQAVGRWRLAVGKNISPGVPNVNLIARQEITAKVSLSCRK
jgi:hypothetical protein